MISIVILTKNEEKNIVDCLESVIWADEIIIVDDNSEDRTVEIVKNINNKKIKIYKHSLNDDFSEQRNYGLSKTSKKWVMFVDADERVSIQLKEEINAIIINRENSNTKGYIIKRKDILWGKLLKHGETGNISFLRLSQRDAGIWIGTVHEKWNVTGRVSYLDSSLFHYPHPIVNEFLREINFYSTIRAGELLGKAVKVSITDILSYPIGKFIYNFFIRLGFLDGAEGLIFALIMSFYSFLVRGKLWLLYQQRLSQE